MYKFVDIKDPEFISEKIRNKLDELNIYGTILIGHEGINGTISSGIHQNLLNALKFIESINGFNNLDLKFSQSEKRPFVRLKVKLKKEIVTIGDTSINPNNLVGVYVDPHEWVKNIRHIRFGRLEKRRNQFQLNALIEAIEQMTGKTMPNKYKENFLQGIEEIDLVRSGLDDMMIDGFQEVKKIFISNEKIVDFRTAAYLLAIEKIAMAYESIGL